MNILFISLCRFRGGCYETSEERSIGVGGYLYGVRCAGGPSAGEGPAGWICEGAKALHNLEKIEITSLACGASDTTWRYHCMALGNLVMGRVL